MTPENAKLEKMFETDYKPPKKILRSLDQYEYPYERLVARVIMCKHGFEEVIKDSDGSTACVKPSSIQKLMERGWGEPRHFGLCRGLPC